MSKAPPDPRPGSSVADRDKLYALAERLQKAMHWDSKKVYIKDFPNLLKLADKDKKCLPERKRYIVYIEIYRKAVYWKLTLEMMGEASNPEYKKSYKELCAIMAHVDEQTDGGGTEDFNRRNSKDEKD